MKKQMRAYITIVFSAVAASNFFIAEGMLIKFQLARPRFPQPELGHIQAMKSHGSLFYVSAIEYIQLGLLYYGAGLAILLALIFCPPESLLRRDWGIFHEGFGERMMISLMTIIIWVGLLVTGGGDLIAKVVMELGINLKI